MQKVDILGVKIDALKKNEFRQRLRSLLDATERNNKIVTTTYSEFIVTAQKDERFRAILNSAELNLADGIGILWAATYLNAKIKNQKLKLEKIKLFLKTAYWTAFEQEKIRDVIPERLPGADIIWDVCQIAEQTGNSIFLLGGHGPVDEILKNKFPALKIAGRYEGNPNEPELAERIKKTNTDILLVAFGPIKQEYWLMHNRSDLNVKIAVGLGGTFDYLVGNKKRAGDTWQKYGLEWLHRLLTQPWRIRRMWNAIIVFSWLVV